MTQISTPSPVKMSRSPAVAKQSFTRSTASASDNGVALDDAGNQGTYFIVCDLFRDHLGCIEWVWGGYLWGIQGVLRGH